MGKASRYFSPVGTHGHKWYPQDIASLLGLPYIGNIYYVDPTNGNDSNSGSTVNSAVKTVTIAYGKTTNFHHDVVLMVPGGTAGTAETAELAWSNSYTHLLGNTAPTNVSQRSRVLFTTAATSPGLNISGNGCIFSNVQVASFVDSNILVTLSGERNYFSNVHFAGIGDATAGDDTAARCLYINDGDENVFDGCMFGLDTIMRSAANATVEMAGGVQRNSFRDCTFQMASDATTPVHILSTGASGLDRWQRFHNCLFTNFTTNDSAEPAAVFDISAQTGTAHIYLTGDTQLVDIDNWEGTASSKLHITAYTATTNAAGKTINPVVD